MTQNIRKTAQGRTIDMGALILKNEHVRAVGNMSVNARGDVIDGWNQPIDPKTDRLDRQYRREHSNVKDEPVLASAAARRAVTDPVDVPAPPEDFDDEFDKSQVAAAPEKINNLADAIAKARQIRQTTVTPPGEKKTGINKI